MRCTRIQVHVTFYKSLSIECQLSTLQTGFLWFAYVQAVGPCHWRLSAYSSIACLLINFMLFRSFSVIIYVRASCIVSLEKPLYKRVEVHH